MWVLLIKKARHGYVTGILFDIYFPISLPRLPWGSFKPKEFGAKAESR